MTTIQSVKDDLKDIQCFYAHQETFENPRVRISEQLQKKVCKYNNAVSLAAPRLCLVFTELYVKCKTQKELATYWKVTKNYICKLNSRLCEYLVNYFNNCATKVTGKGETT